MILTPDVDEYVEDASDQGREIEGIRDGARTVHCLRRRSTSPR